MERKIEITEDGSHTLFLPEMNEHFHSTHGAIQESLHVFIKNGLLKTEKKKLVIFEVGFGTALNALLTLFKKGHKTIHYFGIEKYPLNETEFQQLNYPQLIAEELSNSFIKMHRCPWGETTGIETGFHLTKIEGDLEETDLDHLPKFDLVYFDAFAPGKQPEMWSEEILGKVAKQTRTGGIFCTYTAKGDVRRALIKNKFDMKKLPGPPGKKEILFGIKS